MPFDFSVDPFNAARSDKEAFLLKSFKNLTEKHLDKCKAYQNIYSTLYSNKSTTFERMSDVPFLPVQLFKNLSLKSINDNEIFKILTSSGTTSQQVSKIYLDRATSDEQTKALVSIVKYFIGKDRLPMLIVDHSNVIKDRSSFSARGAGILGFSSFGKQHTYLLNEQMEINWSLLQVFLEKNHHQPVLLFGFTFMVWQYFLQQCLEKNIKLDLSQAILIHGGGWKKLADLNISNAEFKQQLTQQFNLSRIHNYYGMVEQVGSIFMECKVGHLHTPLFADIIIRDPISLMPLPTHQQGLIQVLSILPTSYPGHSLLTEDLGTWLGEDDCSCGLKGKYFTVQGRLPKAELRGCSDTHAFAR